MTKYATTELLTKVENALREFFREDRKLLCIDANERSITHKLAEHLQHQFKSKGLNVDCEYNRHGDDRNDVKRLYCDCLPSHVPINSPHAPTIYPDIVVHERGSDDKNALVIEVKKSNGDETSHDKCKLRKLTVSRNENEPEDEFKYGYKLGLFLKFDVGNQCRLKHAECYQDGEKQCGEEQSCCCRSLVEKFGSSQSGRRIDR